MPLEIQTHDLKIGTKANLFDYVFNICCIPAFNPLRTLFYLRPSLHRICTVPLPSLHQEKDGAAALQVLCNYSETYYRGKRRLKESPNKIRTDGFAFFMIFFKNVSAKIILKIRSVYRLFTNALLIRYRKGTKKLLESYQIGTKGSSLDVALKATVGEALYSNGRSVDQASVKRCICIDKAWIVRKMVSVYTLLTHYQRFMYASSILDLYAKGALFQTSIFKHLKFLSWVKMCFCFNKRANRLKISLNRILSSAHDTVSEWVVYEFRKFMDISFNALKSIRTYSLLVLIFYMFSLSAQTPRKDSGADGSSHLMALKPGDKIPDAVWNQALELNYFDGKKKTIKFSDLKGKLIILDFWSTGCPACIAGMPKFELIQNRFDQDAIVIFVNSKRNKDTPEKIEARFKKYKADHNYSPSLPTLLDDTIFTALFEHNSIPRSAIINKRGEFIGTSYSDNLSDRNISKMIKDGTLPFQSMGNIINNKFENIPLLADTAGLDYMSVLSGFRVNYNPIYPNVHYINGQTLYQVGNYALRLMYQHAFLDEIKDSESKNYVFDPNVDEMSIKKLFDLQNQKYWYQYFSKDSVAQQVVHEHFRKSLIDNFHLDVVRKNEEIGVYNLKIDLHDNALLTKGGMPIFWVYEGNRNLVIQNTNLNGIANFLRPYLDQPIVIEDPYGQHVDLILPGNFIDLAVSERIALLKSKGIILNYEKRKMEFPYFYLSAK